MTLALDQLFDALAADAALDGVRQTFGFRAPQEHDVGAEPRVVWKPGDAGDNVGDAAAAKSFSAVTVDGTRVYGTLEQLCRLITTAPSDLGDPENERSQWRQTMLLRNAVYAALKRAGGAGVALKAERYITADARLANVTIEMVIGVLDRIEDSAAADMFVRARADIDLQVPEGHLDDQFEAPTAP